MFFAIGAILFLVLYGMLIAMITSAPLSLKSVGHDLDMSPGSWGELTDSSPLLGDTAALRERMEEEGHLYIRGFFPREIIQAARRSILEKLAGDDILDPAYPLMDGVLKPGKGAGYNEQAVRKNESIRRVVFGPEIQSFYKEFLGGEIRPFDFVWIRTMGRGNGTNPHCDLVYMGRGTHQLYTAWIPYSDVTYDIGGLMVLEKSHLQANRLRNYLASDVDTYCENIPGRNGWKFHGNLSTNPATLRQKLGGRWLSSEFQMGDLLTFRMDTVHASIDNRTQHVRLSTDSRYQLASEPIDERWIGENPIAHGAAGKRALIC